MAKTRIGERLSTEAEGSETKTKRSGELAGFTEKYDALQKEFKPLLSALKNQQSVLKKYDQAQGDVLDELAKWTKNSPITIKDNNAIKVQKDVLKKEKEASEKFLENSLDYVHEWQLIVQTRVDASQKQAKDLKNTLDHYEKKVANLTKSREKDLEKDKPVDGDAEDKYKRNEEKLALAREAYESHATDLCNLLEAIVNGAWKDIMPVLIKMMTLEATKLEERNKIVETSNVVTNMKNLAEEYKIDLTTPAPTKAKVVPKNDAKKVSPE